MRTLDCGSMREWLPAYIDGELDVPSILALERHLHTCADCTVRLESLRSLRSALRRVTYHSASDTLRMRLRRRVPQSVTEPVTPTQKPRSYDWGLGLAAGFALAMGLQFYFVRSSSVSSLEDELVSGHVRSLQVSHLQDIASSEHHTVRPWFAGKLDFAPPVTDLADHGYPLTGGRLDYMDHRDVAALTYSHGAHVINLFVWPAAPGHSQVLTLESRRGYHLAHWITTGMQFWAVSDIGQEELRSFAQDLRSGAP